jgi:uncharacterized membrane protein YphA (DoxX/SURF4 family)
MMTVQISQAFQVIIALGLLNVWLIRANWATGYRGGDAKNIKEEFAVYGLPGWFCTLVGILKVSSACLLLLGFWYPATVFPAALLITFLMLGAVSMHAKVKDPIKKTIPAAMMLLMSAVVTITNCCTTGM